MKIILFLSIVLAGNLINNMGVLNFARGFARTFDFTKPIPLELIPKNISFSSYEAASKQEIEELVKKSKVVVFMKGLPEEPACGFSNAVVQILRLHGVPFDAHDVMDKNPLRQGVKEFTGWPTIPQVFINGKFIGGCDILLKMHQTGELIKTLDAVGIKSIATGKPEDVKAK